MQLLSVQHGKDPVHLFNRTKTHCFSVVFFLSTLPPTANRIYVRRDNTVSSKIYFASKIFNRMLARYYQNVLKI